MYRIRTTGVKIYGSSSFFVHIKLFKNRTKGRVSIGASVERKHKTTTFLRLLAQYSIWLVTGLAQILKSLINYHQLKCDIVRYTRKITQNLHELRVILDMYFA